MADTDVGRAHARAIKAMVAAATSYPTYVGEVDTEDDALQYPYLVLWPPPANRLTVTLAGYGGEASTATQITAAGRDVDEVITALDRASAALHRRRPVIVGRRCSLIRQDPDVEPPPPARDPEVSTPERPIYFSFIHVTMTSSPINPPDLGGS